MSLAQPYLVTDLLHPREDAFDSGFDKALHPDGYVDFVRRHGLGAFCRMLTVHTPESRSYWTGPMIDELLVIGLVQGNWDAGVLTPDDLRECMVVANSDLGDSYVTCPRYGRQIFELPRHDSVIRPIGTHIDDLLTDCARRCQVAFSYFDPFPGCSRRGAIRFVARPDIGFDALLNEMETRWGFHPGGPATTSQPDFYQDRFVPALRAHVGFYFTDERPPQYRLPDGCITVTMTLDADSMIDAIAFAHQHMIPEEAHLEPTYGQGCIEHANTGK